MNREPLITAASVTAGVTAILALIVAFGVNLSQDQTAALLGFVAVAAPLLVAWISRSKVTPTADPKNDAGEPLTPEV